jgi:uncharacterized protein YecT (DUF1311 family)
MANAPKFHEGASLRERTGRRTLLLVAVGLSGVVLAAGSAAISFASVATASGPPVVTETFTVLPCSTQTTVGMEGCAEHTVLELDKRINTLAARIYGHLSKRFRTHFVSAARDWVTFRLAECRCESDPYAGGTEAPVAFAECLAAQDRSRITDLTGFERSLTAK